MIGVERIAGGRVMAVSDFLAEREGTIREIMAATGYSRSAVESAIAVLRRERAKGLLDNLRRDRHGPPKGAKPKSEPSAIAAGLRKREEDVVDTSRIVHSALAARSLLEQAWGAPA